MSLDLPAFLKDMTLFAGLEETQLRRVADIGVLTRHAKGASLFLEGGEARGFHVAVSGQVKIFKLSPDGREQILHIYGPGELFGEVPMFEGGRLPANAEATMDSVILFLPRAGLLKLMERDATLAMNMLAALSRKLRRFTVKLESLTLKEAPQRVAAYLLDVSEREGGADSVTLDLTKGHLAGLLGTAQETLSRVLRRLTDSGLIEVAGSRITLKDPEGLRALAHGDSRG